MMSSLRIRLLIPLVVMFIPGLVLAGTVIRSYQQDQQADTLSHAEALAENASVIHGYALRAAETLLESLDQSPELRRGAEACATLLFNIRTIERRYAGLGLADAAGNIVCSSPQPPPGASFADRAYIQAAVETGEFAVSDFQIDRLSGLPTISVARPTSIVAGGVLFASLDLNRLSGLLDPLVADQSATIILTDSRGEALVSTDGVPSARIDELGRQALEARANGSGVVSVGDDGFLVSVTEIRTSGGELVGTVIAAIPRGPIEARALRDLKVAVVVIVGTLLVGIAAALVVNERLLMAPVRRLRAAATRLQHDDLELDLQPGRRGELGDLETSLNNAAVEVRAARTQLSELALVDRLTGTATLQGLQVAADQAEIDGGRYEVYYLTLIGFRDIVATFGYEAADELLRGVASRLTRVTDLDIGRVSGNAFACLSTAPPAMEDRRTRAADAIAESMRQPFQVRDFTISVEYLLGLATFPEHGQGFEMILRRAEVAAQDPGGDATCVVFDPLRHEPRVNNINALSSLQDALANDGLELHYQPVVDLASGRLDHVEALLRWPDGPAPIASPAHFIPLAERAGMIQQLDRWVMSAAVRQARAWMDTGPPIRIAVNVSARSLQVPTFPDFVAQLLDEHGVAASLISVEMTETGLVAYFQDALDVCRRLSELGVSISIDDFGIGHSPILYLRDFPVSEVKIDLSLTQGAVQDPGIATIIQALTTMAAGLGVRSVAEGIETEQERDLVHALGCETGQGYLFAPALHPDQIRAWSLASAL